MRVRRGDLFVFGEKELKAADRAKVIPPLTVLFLGNDGASGKCFCVRGKRIESG